MDLQNGQWSKLLRKLETSEAIIKGLLSVDKPLSFAIMEQKLTEFAELISCIPAELDMVAMEWNHRITELWKLYVAAFVDFASPVGSPGNTTDSSSTNTAINGFSLNSTADNSNQPQSSAQKNGSMLSKRNSKRVARTKGTRSSMDHGRPVCFYDGCRKSFASNRNLNGHLRTHVEIRPYHCKWDACAYKSKRLFAALRHVKLVHFGLKRTKECEALSASPRNAKEYVQVNEQELLSVESKIVQMKNEFIQLSEQ